MVNYKRLSDLEREEISRLLSQQCSFHKIAKALGRNASSISREVNAGSCNKYSYRAVKAQKRARRNAAKRKSGKYKIDDNPELWLYIRQKLKLKWSPRQIAEELEMDYPLDMTMRISPEAIYSYIYVLPRGALKKELASCLRQKTTKEGINSVVASKIPAISRLCSVLRRDRKKSKTGLFPAIGKAI